MARNFSSIVIVMLENALRSKVLENQYMSDLRKKGVFLANSYGVTHSSQPNYIASVGGDTLTLWRDEPGYARWVYEPIDIMATSIVDLLEAEGKTWKSYAEDLPEGYHAENLKCWEANRKLYYANAVGPAAAPEVDLPQWSFPADTDTFSRKHVPFLSFPNIITNPERTQNIVSVPANSTDNLFTQDVANNTLPNYAFYTPNMVNDGHNSTDGVRINALGDHAHNIDNIEKFLRGFLTDDPVGYFPSGTLVAVTFDEGYPYHKRNEIYTLLISDIFTDDEVGTERAEPCNHYNLLKSVEVNFGLDDLGRGDSAAEPLWFLRE